MIIIIAAQYRIGMDYAYREGLCKATFIVTTPDLWRRDLLGKSASTEIRVVDTPHPFKDIAELAHILRTRFTNVQHVTL